MKVKLSLDDLRVETFDTRSTAVAFADIEARENRGPTDVTVDCEMVCTQSHYMTEPMGCTDCCSQAVCTYNPPGC
jgi:hypothetical protein